MLNFVLKSYLRHACIVMCKSQKKGLEAMLGWGVNTKETSVRGSGDNSTAILQNTSVTSFPGFPGM